MNLNKLQLFVCWYWTSALYSNTVEVCLTEITQVYLVSS